MRSKRCRGAVSLMTAVVMLVVAGPGGPRVLLAQAGPAAITVRYSQSLSIKPGPLRGQVLLTDGKTPAANVPVRVWDVARKKFIHETTTDEKGNYALPHFAPGQYRVAFADRVFVDLRVSDAASTFGRPLNVIIPRGKPLVTPQELQVELAAEAPSKLLPTLLIITAGAATAVGIVALAGGFEGAERERIVSP